MTEQLSREEYNQIVDNFNVDIIDCGRMGLKSLFTLLKYDDLKSYKLINHHEWTEDNLFNRGQDACVDETLEFLKVNPKKYAQISMKFTPLEMKGDTHSKYFRMGVSTYINEMLLLKEEYEINIHKFKIKGRLARAIRASKLYKKKQLAYETNKQLKKTK